jgi:hypothetical protein
MDADTCTWSPVSGWGEYFKSFLYFLLWSCCSEQSVLHEGLSVTHMVSLSLALSGVTICLYECVWLLKEIRR